jgi:tetratricopeptide (TPR) repeat protein
MGSFRFGYPSRGMAREPTERRDGRLPGAASLIALFAVATAVRLLVSSQLSFLALWTTPQLDAQENLSWATALAAGNFQWPSPPTHGPAYPYFLAALLKLSGGALAGVRAAQAALGGGTVVLAALVASRLFGRREGLAAGFLLALSGPLAFVDVALWEEVLVLFLVMASLFLLSTRKSVLSAAVSGALLGIASAARPTALLFLLAAAATIVFLEKWPKRLAAAGAMAATAALVLGPTVAASSRAAGHFVFVRTYGAINLFIGNDPAGGGVQNARPNASWDRLAAEPYRNGAGPEEEESYFLRKTLARAAADPAGFARAILSKIVWLTQAEEPRDNHSFAFFRDRSLVLSLLPGFGLLAAFGAAGLLRARRSRPVAPLPLFFLAAAALPSIVALTGLRYRMPVVPLLALYAGSGAVFLFDAARRRDWHTAKVPAALAAAVLVFAHVRTHAPSHVFAEELSLEGNALLEEGRLPEAEAVLRRAAAADPRSGLPLEVLGRVRQKEERPAEARQLFSASLALEPDSRSAHFFLAQSDEALGDTSAALAEYRRAIAISPRFFPARFHLGRLLLRSGEAGEAVAELAAAASLAPEEQDAWLLLGSAAADAGDLPALREALDRTAALGGGESPPAVLLLARRQRLEGDRAGALVTLERLVRSHPESALAAAAYLETARAAGREAEAKSLLDSLGSR